MGQVVTARVSEVSGGQVELSLKMSVVDPERYRESQALTGMSIEDIEVGSFMTGTVDNVQDFGVFIKLDNTCGQRKGS